MSACPSRGEVRLARTPVPASPLVRDALARRWLAEQELQLLSRRAIEKRRNEFVSGRLAAKTATARLRAMPVGRDVVHTLVAQGTDAGRPIAVAASGIRMHTVHLSITHSEDLAIAAAATRPIGIDLTPVQALRGAFDEDVFREGELDGWRQVLRASAADRVRAVGFAAKEAALKWLGVGLRASLHDIMVSPSGLGDPTPCADLGLWTRELTALVQHRGSTAGAGATEWRSETLHGLLVDIGEQVLVGLGG